MRASPSKLGSNHVHARCVRMKAGANPRRSRARADRGLPPTTGSADARVHPDDLGRDLPYTDYVVPETETKDRDRPLVLVTEDITDARELFQIYLESEGFEVVTAANGREAVQRAQDIQPDVVVMDLSMPVMDGFSATEQLKNDARTKDIPVVALSGHVMAQHTARAREAGCDTILPKPSALTDVAAKIRTMLHPAKARR